MPPYVVSRRAFLAQAFAPLALIACPARPAAAETSPPALTLALAGRTCIRRDLRSYAHSGFTELLRVIRRADAALTIFHPASDRSGGDPVLVEAQPLRQLAHMGFDAFVPVGLDADAAFGTAPPGLLRISPRRGALAQYLATPHGEVAFLAASPAPTFSAPPDAEMLRRMLDAVQAAAARAAAVILVVDPSRSDESAPGPEPWLQDFAREAVDAGATAVLCDAPRLLPVALHAGRPIFYGLGNFIFHPDQPIAFPRDETWQSALAVCTFQDGALIAAELYPIALGGAQAPAGPGYPERFAPHWLRGSDAGALLRRWAAQCLPYGTTLDLGYDRATLRLAR